jgi:diaminopimelate epimerase
VNAKQRFYKMHSLGNDFLVLDCVSSPCPLTAEQIALWADRKRGIGFDQLLIIAPPTIKDADFDYEIYNADGSKAEQCGNGTRCVAFLAHYLGLNKSERMIWNSAGGIIETILEKTRQIKTLMTVPELNHADIPYTGGNGELNQELVANGETFTVTPVSMGNPHGVIFVENLIDLDVEVIGKALTQHEFFPEQANIGFCQVVDKQFVRLRVYERGVGETLACGTGACAAVVAAHLNGLVEERVKVSLPGGKLHILWEGSGSAVVMVGDANLVHRGEILMEN